MAYNFSANQVFTNGNMSESQILFRTLFLTKSVCM